LNREAAALLIRNARQAGGFRIDDLADYFAASPDPEVALAHWDQLYIQALFPGGNRLGQALRNRNALRLYGFLRPEQRSALRSGSIPLGALPPAAKEQLLKTVYWSDELLTGKFEDAEVTDLLPDGISPNGRLTLVDEAVELILVPVSFGDSGYFATGAAVSADSYGRIMAGIAGNPDQRTRAETLKNQRIFAVGEGRTLSFRVDLSPELSWNFKLTETLFSKDKTLRADEIPAPFLATAEKARQEAAKRLSDRRQSAPPPPSEE
jgi:hypothetical protein